MKKLLLPLLLVIIPQILFAQLSKKELSNELKNNAKEIRFQEHAGTPSYISFRADYGLTREQAIEYSKGFCTADNVDFTLKNQQTGKDGKTLYRYEQTIAGYPVEFSAWHVHEKNGKVTALNGDIVDIQNFNAIFFISEDEALHAALNYIGAELYMWQNEGEEQNLKLMLNDAAATYYPTGIKVITPVQLNTKNCKLKTAYKFNIYSLKPFDRKMVYVDAQTGEILFDLPLIHFDNEIGTAHTVYSGIRQINTFSNSPTQYILRDNTRGNGIRTLNCHRGTNYSSATEFSDSDNIWNNVNAELDQYATDAHFSTMSTYDYYLIKHNRNSIDNNGFALWSYVHYDYNYVNAFWDGQRMTYGDGDASHTPLTTMDICGHEITHGVTEKTAGLVYQNESGALNEAFSDIFGTAIEFYAVPEDANWLIGEKIGNAFRSMANPKLYNCPNTYHGQYWAFGSGDNGGVHTNSGVLNHWFYLLSVGGSGTNDNGHAYTVQGLGIENAEKIAYKTLTEYLSPSSQYIDAFHYAIVAAGELYGGCTPEVQAVGDAFYAVGVITQPYQSITTADFRASETIFCSLPAQVSFTNKSMNGITYLWDFGDGATSTETNPVHIYPEAGNYTVTLSVDGGACGSGTITKENYIKIDPSMLCAFNMPNSGVLRKEGCSGVFYDAGGPNGNYPNNSNSRLIIHAPGATSIVLTIEEFDIEPGDAGYCNYDYIEFFDGDYATGGTPINNTRYCNTNGNPGTIASTGEYITIHFYSDQYVNPSGYKIVFQCLGMSTPPVAKFSVNTEAVCTGVIKFIDNSLNAPTEWLWDFGDGTTSTEQNPVHEYTQTGNYTVSLKVSNEYGNDTKEYSIAVVIPNAPEVPEDIKACNDEEFEIALTSNGTVYWYENMTDEEPVYIGNTWQHAPIAADKTYFVRTVIKAPEGSSEEYCRSSFTEVRLISETCLSISQNYFEKIIISPNPSNGLFYIKGLKETYNYRYVVTDITGRVIIENQPLTSKIVDISRFTDGIYFITLSTPNHVKTYKLVNAK